MNKWPFNVTDPDRSSVEEPGEPANRLSKVVLPAPEGPMMAKRLPEVTRPETSRRMVFLGSISSVTEQSQKSNTAPSASSMASDMIAQHFCAARLWPPVMPNDFPNTGTVVNLRSSVTSDDDGSCSVQVDQSAIKRRTVCD